jgi:hypothetical protein
MTGSYKRQEFAMADSALTRVLELTDLGYISGSPKRIGESMTEQEQQRLVDHRLADPPRRGGDRERRANLPVFRGHHFEAMWLSPGF